MSDQTMYYNQDGILKLCFHCGKPLKGIVLCYTGKDENKTQIEIHDRCLISAGIKLRNIEPQFVDKRKG